MMRHDALQGERLLDVGCAAGTYTERLARRFERVDAIDIEPERLGYFRRRLERMGANNITVAQMSVEDMAFPDCSFDVVTAIEVLEHVPDLDAGLREIHRVLRPGGRLLVTGPNRYFPLETHGVLIGGRRFSPLAFPGLPWIPPLHRRMADARSFTVRWLRARLCASGFDLRAHDYIMPPFDRSRAGKAIKPITDWLEHTPLRFFGISLVIVCERT
jgi:SAM-dependent methyltransferase